MTPFPKPTTSKKKKKEKLKSLSYYKRKAWESFATFIKVRDCLLTTGTPHEGRCITCGKLVDNPSKNCQAGHFVGGRSGAVLFDEEIVNLQCGYCNGVLKGNYGRYTLVMIDRHGRTYTEALLGIKKTIRQYKRSDYIEVKEKYDKKTEELLNNKTK